MRRILRGEIYYIFQDKNSIRGKPAVIVSSDMGNLSNSPKISIVGITLNSKRKQKMPMLHIPIECNGQNGIVTCEDVTTIDRELVGAFIKKCTDEEMQKISYGLSVALQISEQPSQFDKTILKNEILQEILSDVCKNQNLQTAECMKKEEKDKLNNFIT